MAETVADTEYTTAFIWPKQTHTPLEMSEIEARDSVRAYLNDISVIPVLTAEQEVDLARRIEAGRYAAGILALRHSEPGGPEEAALLNGLEVRADVLAKKRQGGRKRPTYRPVGYGAQYEGRKNEASQPVVLLPQPLPVEYESEDPKGQAETVATLAEDARRLGEDEEVFTPKRLGYITKDGDTVFDDFYEDLVQIVKEGEIAFDRFFEANLRLVVWLVKRKGYRAPGFRMMDFVQEGNLGLRRAIEKFDFKRGNKFGAYAIGWINQRIQRAIDDKAHVIRIPVHGREVIDTMRRAETELRTTLERNPTVAEIAERLKWTVKKVVQNMQYARVRDPVSIEAPIFEDEATIGDTRSVSEPVWRAPEHLRISDALETLPPELAELVRLRFGLEDGKVYNEKTTATKLGISLHELKQQEQLALELLKDELDDL